MWQMARDSFILYSEWAENISILSDNQAGVLIKALLAFVRDEQIPEMDTLTDMCFRFLKAQIDRDSKRYEEVKNVRSEAGKKGAAARWQNGKNSKGIFANSNANGKNSLYVDVDDDDDVDVDVDGKKKDVNNECITARTRARESEDFDDGVWNPDELITTTDGTQIRLGDVHFGETVKVGMKRSGEPGTTILGHKVLTEEEKARMRNRADEFSVKYGGA